MSNAISNLIVDLLRKEEEERILNMGGPIAKSGRAKEKTDRNNDLQNGGRELAHPGDALRRRLRESGAD